MSLEHEQDKLSPTEEQSAPAEPAVPAEEPSAGAPDPFAALENPTVRSAADLTGNRRKKKKTLIFSLIADRKSVV